VLPSVSALRLFHRLSILDSSSSRDLGSEPMAANTAAWGLENSLHRSSVGFIALMLSRMILLIDWYSSVGPVRPAS
jgi:hypothetical protein